MEDLGAAAVVSRALELFDAGACLLAWTPCVETVALQPIGGGVLLRSRDLRPYLEVDEDAGRPHALEAPDLERVAGRFQVPLSPVEGGGVVFERLVADDAGLAPGVESVARAQDALWALASDSDEFDQTTGEARRAAPSSGAAIGRLLARLDALTGASCRVQVDAGLGYPIVVDRDRETGVARVHDEFRCLEHLESDVDAAREEARAVVTRFAGSLARASGAPPVELHRDTAVDGLMFRVVLGPDDSPAAAIREVAMACRLAEDAFPTWRASQEPRA